MINVSIAIDIQQGRIMACQSYFEVVAVTASGFQLILGFFWLLRLIEFQTHKLEIGNKELAAATVPTTDIPVYQICISSGCGRRNFPTFLFC